MAGELESITIETSSLCNSRCIICPQGYNPREAHFMPLEEFEQIIRKFGSLNNVTLCGMYEPLIDNRLESIFSIIETVYPKASIGLFTNASLLDEYTQCILKHNVTFVTCSVHGYSKNVYESIMVGLDRDKVYQNILSFIEAKGGIGEKPKVTISFVRTKQNIHELEIFRSFWNEKADVVSDYEVMNWRGIVPFSELAYEYPKHARACPMFEHPIVIDAEGNVVRCCYCFDRNYGHVLKSGLENWRSKRWDSNPHTFPKKDCLPCKGWLYY